MLCLRCIRSATSRPKLPLLRQLSTYPPLRSSDVTLTTPVTGPGADAPKEPVLSRSMCAEGTVLTGLNYAKGGKDPVAMKDEDYPEWLWSCLDVIKKASDAEDGAEGDEFSKSKKLRRAAMKRQRALEAKLQAEGNLAALAPKVPLHEQSINLPGEVGGSLDHNVMAAEKRDELKKAMRKARKAKIKEDNFLRSM